MGLVYTKKNSAEARGASVNPPSDMGVLKLSVESLRLCVELIIRMTSASRESALMPSTKGLERLTAQASPGK